jgi:hypothetical protein
VNRRLPVRGYGQVIGAPSATAFNQAREPKAQVTEDLKKKVFYQLEKFYGISDFTVAQAKAGDKATGLMISETDQTEITLDTDPCNKVIKVFTKPYEKNALKETANCRGKLENKVEVTKK